MKKIHLIDNLSTAQIKAPAPNYVEVHSFTILRETRMAIFNHPDSSFCFKNIETGTNCTLSFGIGIKEACWESIQSRIIFTLYVDGETYFEETLNPKTVESNRCWKDYSIELPRKTYSLCFETRFEGNGEYCWSGWSDPVLAFSALETAISRPQKHPLILMITADALRADYLGCYGSSTATPHIDALAADGTLFTHARAQSPTTLGSYASLLTGTMPDRHGIHTEWGTLSHEIETLPLHLQRNGYHTIFAPSEEELSRPIRGFTRNFRELIPTLAVPGQDGAITTRQVSKRIEEINCPTFIWIEYFDTHPPHTPIEPFRSMYYEGNPADVSKRFDTASIKEIHGVETLLEMKKSLLMINQGYKPTGLYNRLMSVARSFRHPEIDGPDLVDHLKAVGPKAYLNMKPESFAGWLEHEAESLLNLTPSAQFMEWFYNTYDLLARIEREIISWLDGVVDFRYPLEQYRSSVSYFDHQLGQLIHTLKEHDLYDNTLIILTSPHGELLGEHGVHFHHHLLAEEVLRIPMIIKPLGENPSQQLEGIFNSIDLFPTLCDALSLFRPDHLEGTSRWGNIIENQHLPSLSQASCYNKTMRSVVNDNFLYIKCLKDIYYSDLWAWKAGDSGLYKLQQKIDYKDNLIYNHPNIAAAMEQHLNAHTLPHAPVLS